MDLEGGVYLASGLDIGGEALAWTPLPRAWEGETEKYSLIPTGLPVGLSDILATQ